MAKIAIDCDGVLANFLKTYFQVAARMYPDKHLDINYQPVRWHDTQGLNDEEDKAVWAKITGTVNFWMTLDPLHSNLGALMIFLYSTKGHDVYIVTSRAKTAGNTTAFQTDVWLRASGVQPHSNYLAILAVDNYHNKRKIYEAGQFDFSIDDKKETVEDCDKISDHRAFLLDQNWNQDAVVKNRVKGVEAFLREVAPKWGHGV